MYDEYHRRLVTVYLYFLGVYYLEFKYPNWMIYLAHLNGVDPGHES